MLAKIFRSKIFTRTSLLCGGILGALLIAEILMRLGGLFFLVRNELLGRGLNSEKRACRILCLGESTTAPRTIWGTDISWPAQLEKILQNRYPERTFQAINKGRPGTQSGLIVAKLSDYIDQYRPEVAIAMIGTNDSEWYGIVKATPGIDGSVEKNYPI